MTMSFEPPLYSSTRADVAFMNQTGVALGVAQQSFGPFPTGNIDAIKAVLDNILGGGILTRWDFYADPDGTQLMGSHLAACTDGGALTQAWPVLGAWCYWRVTATAALTVDLRLSSNARPGKPMANSNQNTLISMAAPAALAAAGNVTLSAPRTYIGEAVWTAGYVANDAGAWEAYLESVSQTGLIIAVLDYANSRDGRCSRQVFLPGRPCRIRMINLDGAAPHNYLVSLTADPAVF